ncbi:MAG: hypothetical protein AB2375_03280 [Tissierellaceae bacterium]
MKENIKKNTVITSSSNHSFVFYIDNNHNLISQQIYIDNNSTNTTVIENNILDFSAIIDKNDRIHLLYLLKNGELIYSIYLNEKWQKNLIGKLDTKSNIYKYLNLFLHEKHISIFYVFANLINTNLWTIEEITQDSVNWKKRTITNTFSEKNFSPIYIDRDNFGGIHLVYKAKEYSFNQIYYTFYNAFTEKWSPISNKISSSATNNILPYLFVDSRNNVHILWYSSIDGKYLLTYKRLSSMGQNKYQWTEIRLPKIIASNFPSIMFEKDNKLNIIYITKEELCCLVSQDFGKNWMLENEIPLSSSTLHLIEYHSNLSTHNSDKINHCYGNIDKNIYFFIDENLEKEDLNKITVSSLDLDDKDKNTIEKQEEKIISQDIETDKLRELNTLLWETYNQTIENYNSIEKNSISLKEIIDTENDIRNELKLIKEKIMDIEKKQNNKKGFFRL